MTITISNGTAVVNSVKKSWSNSIPISQTDTTNSISTFDTFIKAQSSTTIPDNYSPESQEPISPEDAKYLNLCVGTNGDYIHFPPDTASPATKKAWIEAMKKLPSDQRMGFKMAIMIATGNCTANPDEEMTKNIAGIASYQALFEGILDNLNKSAEPGKEALTQRSIDTCNTIIDIFAKYNIK